MSDYSLGRFLLYFLRLGTFGFGGPIALAGHMQRDLVEQRKWIDPRDYDEGLALAQLSPGPLAAQLAIYLGWVRARTRGALLVSLAFVGPSFVMVIALSALYVKLGQLSWMRGAFYGIGAAVIAIIARSAFNLLKKTLEKDRLLWCIAAINAAVTAITASELVLLVIASGVVAMLVRVPGKTTEARFVLPPVLVTGLKGPASLATLGKVLAYFASAGIFVFGSGLAIVPFLHGGVVDTHRWLDERQFLDAVAVAMITPGPVVITVAFIGYLVGGLLGGTLAAIGVFLPCFLIVLIAAPHYRRIAAIPRIRAFVKGVTAAAVGAIAGAVIVIGRRSITDTTTVILALGSLGLLTYTKKIPEPILIVLAGAIGIVVRGRHA